MKERVRELLDRHYRAGDLDDVLERIGRVLEDERGDGTCLADAALMREVVDAILDKFRGRFDDMPEPLLANLLDYGHITRSEDAGLTAMLDRLTREERYAVACLEHHMTVAERNALIAGILTGNGPITARVLATLSWDGLETVEMLTDKASDSLIASLHKAGDPRAASVEQAYENLCETVMFFPYDPDELEMEAEEDKAKRRDTESAMLERVNFLKAASKPACPVSQKS